MILSVLEEDYLKQGNSHPYFYSALQRTMSLYKGTEQWRYVIG